MALFDKIIGGLTGERELRRSRDRSIEATRQMYNPSQLDPMADAARRQATQGIDTDMYRRPVLNQLFRPVMDASAFGGSQAAAIAGTASVDATRGQSLAQFESGLMAQDVAVRQAGAAQLGAVQTQQNQLYSARQAMTGQIRAEFSAQKDQRRRQLATSALNFGIAAAGGAGAIGKVLGGGIGAGFGKLQSLFAKVPELSSIEFPSIEIPEAVTAGLQKGASFAQQYGDAARTFQEVGMGLGIGPELRPIQGIFGGLPTNPIDPLDLPDDNLRSVRQSDGTVKTHDGGKEITDPLDLPDDNLRSVRQSDGTVKTHDGGKEITDPPKTNVSGGVPPVLSEEEFNRLFEQQQTELSLSPFKATGRFLDNLFSTDVSSGGNFSSGNVRATVDAQRRKRYEEYLKTVNP
jgi:hypothetical protein